jgi:hypothetical protein
MLAATEQSGMRVATAGDTTSGTIAEHCLVALLEGLLRWLVRLLSRERARHPDLLPVSRERRSMRGTPRSRDLDAMIRRVLDR